MCWYCKCVKGRYVRVICGGYCDTDNYCGREVVTAYENPTKSKEISVEDIQKIVDANEKIVKELKDGNKRTELI